jgi:hypothetical protein
VNEAAVISIIFACSSQKSNYLSVWYALEESLFVKFIFFDNIPNILTVTDRNQDIINIYNGRFIACSFSELG